MAPRPGWCTALSGARTTLGWARVFERFYRVDSSRTRASGGEGLGLSIVGAVVEAHSGTAEAQATPGGGATFVITLPLGAG